MMTTRTLLLLALLASPLAAQDSIRSYRVMRPAETDSTVSYFTRIVTPPPVHDTVTIRDTLRLYWNGTAWSTTATIPPGSVAPCEGVQVAPGASIQAASSAAGTGDTLCLGAGMHRMQSVTPKQGQVFLGAGQGQTILTGAKVLTGPWTQSGGTWWIGGQTQQNTDVNPNYTCQPNHPGCYQPEQVWVNDSLYEVVTSLAAIGTRTWFFDYPADRIYLPFNPADSTVLASVTQYAFGGGATGVTVKHLTIERYATEAQQATVNWSKAQSWTIDSNVIRHNHGVGAIISANGKLRWNEIHHNGQASVMAFGQNPLIEGNYLHHNNTAFFGPGPFGMASNKFVTTTGLIVRNNVSTHNDGPGLWSDINNVDCLYEGNRVDSNGWRGIFHEISYDCVIRNNTVRFNGHAYPGPTTGAFEGAGILVSNSPNVEVYGNVVEDNRNGILGREEDREDSHPSPLGPHNITNLNVYDNDVKQTNGLRAAGITDTDPGHDPHSAAANNRWANNRYVCTGTTKFRWTGNLDKTRAQWQAAGQDLTAGGSTFSGC